MAFGNALDDYTNQLYQQILSQDVGQGKRFASQQQLDSWIAGQGHGLEEAFGAGPSNDKDPLVQMLVNLRRMQNGGAISLDNQSLAYYAKSDPNFAAVLQKLGVDPNNPGTNWRSILSGGQGQSQPGASGQGGQGQGGPDEEALYQAWRDQTIAQLQQYANKMNMSVPDLVKSQDPGVMNAMAQGMRTGGAQNLAAGASGGGGLSVLNTQKAAMDSMNAYQMQRAQLGLQANTTAAGLINNAYMSDEQRRQYEQGLNLQLQQANNAAAMFKGQQQAQAIGQVAGVVGGAISSYAGYGPQVGYQMGSGLGSGLAGAGIQAPTYKYPSGNGAAGSGGGMTGFGTNPQ